MNVLCSAISTLIFRQSVYHIDPHFPRSFHKLPIENSPFVFAKASSIQPPTKKVPQLPLVFDELMPSVLVPTAHLL